MRSAKSVGRIIGMLLLVQLAGLIVPFVLLHPLTTGARDFLANFAFINRKDQLHVISRISEH